ncbi:MAG TPA: hypothetical protein VN697_04370, partial [Tepidiformaceae bacterium]|nr:hypothetical protein [Tepidiformaceae bacterium]
SAAHFTSVTSKRTTWMAELLPGTQGCLLTGHVGGGGIGPHHVVSDHLVRTAHVSKRTDVAHILPRTP